MSFLAGNYSHQGGESKLFRNAISKSLLEVCNGDLLTSYQIRPAGLLKALQGEFLDKGAQILMGRLSNLPGKTAGRS